MEEEYAMKKIKSELMFCPSKPPKIEGEDAGIRRRLLLVGRNPGKAVMVLDEAVATMKQTNPTAKTIGFFSYKNGEQILKNHPRVVRVGRWFYYNYNGELIYIKLMKVEIPKGKTIKINRVRNVKFDEYLAKAQGYKMEPSAPFTLQWGTKWKDEE